MTAPFVRVEHETLPAGLRAYAVCGDDSSLTVRVSAELPPGAQRRAVRKALHAAHVDVLQVLPAVVPAVTGGAATAARRFALHPLTALAGSAVAGVAAMILTAGPPAVVPADAGASLPGSVPVIPAHHHHHRRRPQAGAPGAGPSPASPGAATRRSPAPGGRRSASAAPPGPSPSSSPAASSPPSPVPAEPAPQPAPSSSSPPAQPPPAPGGVLCVNLQPVLGLCLLKAA